MEQILVTKLELVRVEGIVKMLIESIDHDALKGSLSRLYQMESDDTRASLERLTRYQLIRIADDHSDLITVEVVNRFYEQYRYGLKPGFTLYLLSGPQTSLSIEQISIQLKQTLNGISDMTNSAVKRVRCKSYIPLADQLAEFSMSFLKKHSYLDENEVPQYIYEFEEFFVWLSVSDQYLAIKNVPDRVGDTVLNALRSILHQGIIYIKLTKPIIREAFGVAQRKGTYLKANASENEAEKITVSDAHLQDKENVLDSLATYDMTSTFLAQTMDDNSVNTLGINCNKGKLYLTKNVPASLFRAWSVSAIQKIIPLVTDMSQANNYETFRARNVINKSTWCCTNKQASIIENIVYGLFESIRNSHGIAYMNVDAEEIWNNTQKYWFPRHTAECPVCGDQSFLYCPHCNSNGIRIGSTGKLFCSNCGQKIDSAICDEGHPIPISNPYDTLTLFPTREAYDNISAIFLDQLLLPFDNAFQIAANRVELYPLQTCIQLGIEDIPELRQVQDTSITEQEYCELHDHLSRMKEKCRATKSEACNKCVLSTERECLMKVFTTYRSFRPSPHSGDEFADISFPVTVRKNKVTLVGVIKSTLPDNKNLTRASAPAREMLQQIFSMSQDTRVNVIAAVCPSRFQDQFEADLQYLSKLTGRSIVIFDDMYMCKQYKIFRESQKD